MNVPTLYDKNMRFDLTSFQSSVIMFFVVTATTTIPIIPDKGFRPLRSVAASRRSFYWSCYGYEDRCWQVQ
jgi:hypothetical protein